MICEVCGGRGWVFRLPHGMNPFEMRLPGIEKAMQRVPCPDCIGGTAHCCDGICAQPETPARSGSEGEGREGA